jgi:mannose-1-phosphate guanylyltransferase
MLKHTLARVEMLIPRPRIMVVVSDEHQPEIEQQLAHWPGENVIVQPENRDTTAGILLPLVHIASRDPAKRSWQSAFLLRSQDATVHRGYPRRRRS